LPICDCGKPSEQLGLKYDVVGLRWVVADADGFVIVRIEWPAKALVSFEPWCVIRSSKVELVGFQQTEISDDKQICFS
jgi:hypothetical protein